jgi:hypothetical protein
MFTFENGPDIEALSNAPEFLGDTLSIWDNDRALVCCICRRTVTLDGFIVESTNSCRYS